MTKYGTSVYPIDLRSGKEKGKLIIHPEYYERMNSDNNVIQENDIAIVKLKEPIIFPGQSDHGFSHVSEVPDETKPVGTFVRPICLPSTTRTTVPRVLYRWGAKNQKKANENIKKDEPSS